MEKGTPYRLIKLEESLFESLVLADSLPRDRYLMISYGIEGEEYPEDARWVEAFEAHAEARKVSKKYYKETDRCRDEVQSS